jgi:hypothetical protein
LRDPSGGRNCEETLERRLIPTFDSLVMFNWFNPSSPSRSSEEPSEALESVFPLPWLDFPLDSLGESAVCSTHPWERKHPLRCEQEQHLEGEQPIKCRISLVRAERQKEHEHSEVSVSATNYVCTWTDKTNLRKLSTYTESESFKRTTL